MVKRLDKSWGRGGGKWRGVADAGERREGVDGAGKRLDKSRERRGREVEGCCGCWGGEWRGGKQGGTKQSFPLGATGTT